MRLMMQKDVWQWWSLGIVETSIGEGDTPSIVSRPWSKSVSPALGAEGPRAGFEAGGGNRTHDNSLEDNEIQP